jgi:hypothetical protein
METEDDEGGASATEDFENLNSPFGHMVIASNIYKLPGSED